MDKFDILGGPLVWIGRKAYKKIQDSKKEEQKKNIETGIRIGNNESAKKFADMLEKSDANKIAYFALGLYVAGLDGLSKEDLDIIKQKIGDPNSNLVGKALREKYKAIFDERPTFATIKAKYLDVVQKEFLVELDNYIKEIMLSDNIIDEAEKNFLKIEWYPYLITRGIRTADTFDSANNLNEEMKLTEEDIRQFDADTLNKYGLMYDQGNGVKKDIAQAIKYYTMAAEKGSADAKCNLGLLYEFGNGVPMDEEKAVSYYREAANLGLERGKQNLRRTGYLNKPYPSRVESSAKFEEAEDTGEEEFKKLINGKFDMRVLMASATHGDDDAMYKLGLIEEFGGGYDSKIEACKWYERAAKNGHSKAKKRLNALKDSN